MSFTTGISMKYMLELKCYVGADLAFDEGTLIDYSASRMYSLSTNLIANITAKAKSFVAAIAQAFQPQVLAPALV